MTAIEVRSAGKAGQMPLSILGIWPPRSSTTCKLLPRAPARSSPRPRARCRACGTPARSRSGRRARRPRSSGRLPSWRRAPAKLATSMWSEPIRYVPPPSRSTPAMRRMFEPIALDRAPSPTRKRQRSWMCGSHAAWPTIVSPSASTAAMTAFSVAHHRRLVEEEALADEPVGADVVGAVQLDLDAELLERVDVRVEPPAADHVAARRRHRHPAEARQQRAGEQERGADLAAELRVERGLGHAATRRRAPRSARSTRPSAPRSASSSTIVSTSWMRGTLASVTGSEASSVAARIGSAPFLLPGGANGARERTAAFDHEGLHAAAVCYAPSWR